MAYLALLPSSSACSPKSGIYRIVSTNQQGIRMWHQVVEYIARRVGGGGGG